MPFVALVPLSTEDNRLPAKFALNAQNALIPLNFLTDVGSERLQLFDCNAEGGSAR